MGRSVLTHCNPGFTIVYSQINQCRSRGQQGYKYAAGEIKKGRERERVE